MYIINSRFLSCCAFNQIITINSSTNTPTPKEITLALRVYVCLCGKKVKLINKWGVVKLTRDRGTTFCLNP